MTQHASTNRGPLRESNSCFRPRDRNNSRLIHLVLEQFLPRFGFESITLRTGRRTRPSDVATNLLGRLCITPEILRQLPDIVAYSSSKNWVYLIECVHSAGHISPVRLAELLKLTKNCRAEFVFVSAFLNRGEFCKFAHDIAWETEVWIADAPDHVVHFDGDKFFGPYARRT